MTTAADVQIEEKVSVSLQPPKMWKVVFINDDQTPMDLVIELLMDIFKHDLASAKTVTLEIHETGSGIAGVYPHEIAEQRGIEATAIARANGSPLRIQIEQED